MLKMFHHALACTCIFYFLIDMIIEQNIFEEVPVTMKVRN